MVASAAGTGPAVRMVLEARQAATLDTLTAVQQTGLYDRLVVVTNDPLWAGGLPLDCIVDLDDTSHPFHFGRRLASVIDYYELTHVLYMGAGAAPLLGSADLARIGEAALATGRSLVTNNLHSSDWVAFSPAGILERHALRVPRDNSLAWVLHREADLPAEAWAPCAATRMDIDTPADLLVLARHQGCGPRLAEKLAELELDTGRVDQALAVLAADGKHLLVAGRVGSSVWAALERETQCWVRLFSEERGMAASGRQASGQVRSLLAAYLEQVGVNGFVDTLEDWADAVFLDDRVLLAHKGIWPSAEDRYASDLGWVKKVRDPFLKSLTAGVSAASIPILLGGHSLVSGGLLALVEISKLGAGQ